MVTDIQLMTYLDARCFLTELPVAFCAHCKGQTLENGTPLVGDDTAPWLRMGHPDHADREDRLRAKGIVPIVDDVEGDEA